MELKKSYKGFLIWIILFCILSVGACLLPIKDSQIMARIVNNICSFGITGLTFLIYKTENVYWYNGTSYEEAQEAGSERRKRFAWKHFKRFGLFSLVFFLFTVIAQIVQLRIWIDVVTLTVGLVAVAVSTIRFKL